MNHKELCKLVADGDLQALKNGVKSSVDAALHWKPIMDAAFGAISAIALRYHLQSLGEVQWQIHWF